MPTRTFISFDFDHDEDLKILLVGQSRLADSPFSISDWSIKEAIDKRWQDKARARIGAVDVVAVMCGQYTHIATGVSAEIRIAQELRRPYFLLAGRADKSCTRPVAALATDKMYSWTWPNLKTLIGGSR